MTQNEIVAANQQPFAPHVADLIDQQRQGVAWVDQTEASIASPDDAALIALLRRRAPDGLSQLYERYGRLVYSVAYRVVQEQGAAEEITQDVFLRCWNHFDRYQAAQGTLTAWLLTIAHRRAIDELRSRRGKDQRRELSVDVIQPITMIDPSYDEALIRQEVRAGLSTLPSAQREAIELIFWGGLTRREAADQLNIPIGTLHTRLRLGMDKLREGLGRLFVDE